MVNSPAAMVIAGPGTNRDGDVAFALELAGAAPAIVLIDELHEDPRAVDGADIVVIAGGFSYGDALGAGRMLALDVTDSEGGRVGDALRRAVDRGRPVIGICNGFQVLTRAGLLPGALGHNASGNFDCRWVELAVEEDTRCVWTRHAPPTMHCPIAHGEGRYVHPDPDALGANRQVVVRYLGGNPNGSVADIAGVCDESGLVLGLMPHPENHVVRRQHPRHRRDTSTARRLGLGLFRSAVEHVS
jgi:phosphoribosylformylglycinamidine synthase subunit PurQ / glutaminase